MARTSRRGAGDLPVPWKSAWMHDLSHSVEVEVIPRLVRQHAPPPVPSPTGAVHGAVISEAEVCEFAHLVLAQDAAVVRDWVDGFRARGIDPRRICLDLLAPAAHRLGVLWTEDLCDFTQVTLGLWRIQQIQHDVAACFRLDIHAHDHGRRALFCTLPGDQHTFGISMLADFFRHRQWDVRLECPGHPTDTFAALRRESFDLLGVSLGSETRLDELKRWIAEARRVSRRANLVVMVGGPIFATRADLAASIGADAGACDAATAVDVAEALLPVHFAHG